MKHLKSTAFITALCLISSISVQSIAAQTPETKKLDLAAPIKEEVDINDTRVSVRYIDPAGYLISEGFLEYPGSEPHTVVLSDLTIPDGFVLAEDFEPVEVPAGDFTILEVLVNSANPTLADLYASQNQAENPNVLTINYWTQDWNLVDSQTEPISVDAAAGGLPTIYLNQEYFINVPEGYKLITPAPESLQGFFYNARTIVDLQVVPTGSSTTTSSTTTTTTPGSSTSQNTTDKKSPNTALETSTLLYGGMLLTSAGGLFAIGQKLRRKDSSK